MGKKPCCWHNLLQITLHVSWGKKKKKANEAHLRKKVILVGKKERTVNNQDKTII